MNIRSFKQLFSVVFALVLGGFLLILGVNIPRMEGGAWLESFQNMANENIQYYRFTVGALCIVGLLIGSIVGPKLALSIINAGNAIEKMSARDKVAVGIGAFLGFLATVPVFLIGLRAPLFGVPISILVGSVFIYLGVRGTMSMKNEFHFVGPVPMAADVETQAMDNCKILDTNVIIDGRIIDVCRTGFIEGALYVPGFVLDELQHIADSSDSLRRARGRRGLDILNAMQKEFPLIVRTWDFRAKDSPNDEVDTRLVMLAKSLNGDIVTNDFNLNKVAALQGVTVLNVNELANALKPVVLPGEEMMVLIIKEGKEPTQGVAYLDDGTMIVVEDGRRHIGETQKVVVTSVLQTVAGKMIFARIRDDYHEGDEHSHEGGRGRPGGGPRYKVR